MVELYLRRKEQGTKLRHFCWDMSLNERVFYRWLEKYGPDSSKPASPRAHLQLKAEDAILKIMADGRWFSRLDISKALSLDSGHIYNVLAKLAKQGKLQKKQGPRAGNKISVWYKVAHDETKDTPMGH